MTCAERSGETSRPLADQDHRICIEGDLGSPIIGHAGRRIEPIEQTRFVTRGTGNDPGPHLAYPVARIWRQGPGDEALLPERFAEPEEDHAGFLFRLKADKQYRTGIFKISEADVVPGTGYHVRQKVGFLAGMLPRPEVDVVGAQDGAGELGVAVRVLEGKSTAGQDPDRTACGLEALHGHVDRFRPGGRPEHVTVADQRAGETVFAVSVTMREPILVGDPLLIDVGIIPGQTSHHDAASVIDPDGRGASSPGSAPFAGQIFFNPGPGEVGNLQRRMFSGPWEWSFDASVKKSFIFRERHHLDLHFDMFNFMNHPTFGGPQMDQFNSAFGQITAQANYARQIQATLRLSF